MPISPLPRHVSKCLISREFERASGRPGESLWTLCVTALTGVVKRPSLVTRNTVAYACRPLAFERAAKLQELPAGRGICVRIGGLEIGLYRVGDEVYALENACPHAGWPLHEGEVSDRVVICGGHGFEYDLATGRPPGSTDGFGLARYPVEIRGDDVYVDGSSNLD